MSDRRPCAHCHEFRKGSTVILGQSVCDRCRLRFSRQTASCPGCGQARVLAWFDHMGRPACARCTGNRPVFSCKSCGREDSQHGSRCAPCVLAERVAALLADRTGQVHPRLQPVHDALLAARRPQTVIYWLTRSPGPAVLQAMASGEIDISHAALDHVPASRARDYLRELLVAVEVLPPYQTRLEAITPWLLTFR